MAARCTGDVPGPHRERVRRAVGEAGHRARQRTGGPRAGLPAGAGGDRRSWLTALRRPMPERSTTRVTCESPTAPATVVGASGRARGASETAGGDARPGPVGVLRRDRERVAAAVGQAV